MKQRVHRLLCEVTGKDGGHLPYHNRNVVKGGRRVGREVKHHNRIYQEISKREQQNTLLKVTARRGVKVTVAQHRVPAFVENYDRCENKN